MRNPIASGRRMRGMRVRLLLLLAVVSALTLAGAAAAARADNPVLVGDVGANNSYSISLKDSAGNKVTHLDTGTYTLVVHDHSDFHNFHLFGPGAVDAATTVDEIGDKTFTITLTDGTYRFDCDAHPTQMKGTFTVGAVTTPPPAAATRLTASIGPGKTFALAPRSGVSAGKAVITVRDRSAADGFRLSGPGVAKTTGVKFTGTVTWKVTLAAGRYSFGSLRSSKLRRAFTVSP